MANYTKGPDRKGIKSRAHSTHPGFVLTPRELEIVKLAAQGLVNKQVAAKLGVARQTVKHHRHNVFRKTGLANSVQMITMGLIWGWISMEDLGGNDAKAETR